MSKGAILGYIIGVAIILLIWSGYVYIDKAKERAYTAGWLDAVDHNRELMEKAYEEDWRNKKLKEMLEFVSEKNAMMDSMIIQDKNRLKEVRAQIDSMKKAKK